MPTDEVLIRSAAVVAAAALVAAPYRDSIVGWLATATEAARSHASTIGRVAAAGLLIAAAWGQVPLPKFSPPMPTVSVEVEMPTDEMRAAVAPVAREMAKFPAGDRMVWAATWNKAAMVVAGDTLAKEVAFTDTRALRLYTALALDIAWRRIGGHAPGNQPLREALEASYGQAVGTDEAPVSRDVRDRYVAFAKAVAWAGLNGG
jgi:hypothetical protein